MFTNTYILTLFQLHYICLLSSTCSRIRCFAILLTPKGSSFSPSPPSLSLSLYIYSTYIPTYVYICNICVISIYLYMYFNSIYTNIYCILWDRWNNKTPISTTLKIIHGRYGSSILRTYLQPGIVAHICNFRGTLQVQVQFGLHKKFQPSQICKKRIYLHSVL